jgi:hypothetical protein
MTEFLIESIRKRGYHSQTILRNSFFLATTFTMLLPLAPCYSQSAGAPPTTESRGTPPTNNSSTLIVPPDVLSRVPNRTDAATAREIIDQGKQSNPCSGTPRPSWCK